MSAVLEKAIRTAKRDVEYQTGRLKTELKDLIYAANTALAHVVLLEKNEPCILGRVEHVDSRKTQQTFRKLQAAIEVQEVLEFIEVEEAKL